MVSILLRAANKADIIAWRGRPYKESFRGIVADLDGEIIGIAGVLHSSQLKAFSEITDELRNRPKMLILGAREFRGILNSYNYPIYAHASEEEINATGYLEYVGFEHYQKRIYKWVPQQYR